MTGNCLHLITWVSHLWNWSLFYPRWICRILFSVLLFLGGDLLANWTTNKISRIWSVLVVMHEVGASFPPKRLCFEAVSPKTSSPTAQRGGFWIRALRNRNDVWSDACPRQSAFLLHHTPVPSVCPVCHHRVLGKGGLVSNSMYRNILSIQKTPSNFVQKIWIFLTPNKMFLF